MASPRSSGAMSVVALSSSSSRSAPALSASSSVRVAGASSSMRGRRAATSAGGGCGGGAARRPRSIVPSAAQAVTSTSTRSAIPCVCSCTASTRRSSTADPSRMAQVSATSGSSSGPSDTSGWLRPEHRVERGQVGVAGDGAVGDDHCAGHGRRPVRRPRRRPATTARRATARPRPRAPRPRRRGGRSSASRQAHTSWPASGVGQQVAQGPERVVALAPASREPDDAHALCVASVDDGGDHGCGPRRSGGDDPQLGGVAAVGDGQPGHARHSGRKTGRHDAADASAVSGNPCAPDGTRMRDDGPAVVAAQAPQFGIDAVIAASVVPDGATVAPGSRAASARPIGGSMAMTDAHPDDVAGPDVGRHRGADGLRGRRGRRGRQRRAR